jgi:hypothetical protein
VAGRCEMMDDAFIKIINDANPKMTPWNVYTTLLYEITGMPFENLSVCLHNID